jgi:hypothetical protein
VRERRGDKVNATASSAAVSIQIKNAIGQIVSYRNYGAPDGSEFGPERIGAASMYSTALDKMP